MDWKMTIVLRLVSLFKCPMVFFLGMIVEEINLSICKIRVPLRFRSKNPMGSMYFGALASGADVAGALIAYKIVMSKKASVSILFRDMRAEFFKKATDDVVFVCKDGAIVERVVNETLATCEGVEADVTVNAYLRSNVDGDPVAKFKMLLAVKARRARTAV